MSLPDSSPERQQLEDDLAAALARVEQSPQDADLNGLAGDRLVALQRYKEALKYYRRLVRLIPQDPNAWFALAIGAAQAGAFEQAREAFEWTLKLGHDNGLIRANRAWVFYRLNRPKEAIEDAERALTLPLHHPLGPIRGAARLHTLLGDSYVKLADLEAAVRHYRVALELDPDDAYTQSRMENYAASLESDCS